MFLSAVLGIYDFSKPPMADTPLEVFCSYKLDSIRIMRYTQSNNLDSIHKLPDCTRQTNELGRILRGFK